MWVEKHCAGCGTVIERVNDPAAKAAKVMGACDDCNSSFFKSKPKAAKPEAAKPKAAKPEAAKPKAAKPEAAKPKAAKPEGTEPDHQQPEAPAQ